MSLCGFKLGLIDSVSSTATYVTGSCFCLCFSVLWAVSGTGWKPLWSPVIPHKIFIGAREGYLLSLNEVWGVGQLGPPSKWVIAIRTQAFYEWNLWLPGDFCQHLVVTKRQWKGLASHKSARVHILNMCAQDCVNLIVVFPRRPGWLSSCPTFDGGTQRATGILIPIIINHMWLYWLPIEHRHTPCMYYRILGWMIPPLSSCYY